MSDFASAEASLRAALPAPARLERAERLPLKRLAVRCGLARYGRNNVSYIDGMGSNFSYMAFFSDRSCGEGEWGEAAVAAACSSCGRCAAACPTGAIRGDRFLIDNERCLSALNESGSPFPEWLDAKVHHTLYDCLRCQAACPMNSGQAGRLGDTIRFDEEETAALLSGARPDSFPPSLAAKARYLGAHQWPDGLARNVRAIIDGGERGA
jgi:epoxyqueuosine reductase